jgi:penicillin-binding protein 1A
VYYAVAGAVILVVVMSASWTIRTPGRSTSSIAGSATRCSTTPTATRGSASTSSAGRQLEQISTYFKDAVIAVEDHRFYRHPGIDPIGLTARSVLQPALGIGVQGGSTITQQLARTLYLSNARTYGAREGSAYSRHARVFLSKREILELYLNRVYSERGIYGVETMSEKMLRKPASQLTLEKPRSSPASFARRPRIRRGRTSTPRAAAASSCCSGCARRRRSPLRRSRRRARTHPHPAAAAVSSALRLREGVSPPAVPRHLRRRQPTRLEGAHDVRAGDPGRRGERRSRWPARLGRTDLQAALVAIDPRPATCSRWSAARTSRDDLQPRRSQQRQPGSAFKPFVYAAALETALSPVSKSTARQVAVQAPEGVWIPRDERAAARTALTLREALLESNNAAAVSCSSRSARVRCSGSRAISASTNQPTCRRWRSAAVSSTPLDLTAAYAVFPNLGYRVRPRGLVVGDNAAGERAQVHIEREQILRRRWRSRWSRCCRTS